MKTAHLAESFGMHCELHTTIYHPLEIVNLHCCAAIANCEFFEVLYPLSYMDFGMKTPIQVDAEGYAHPPGVAWYWRRLGLGFHRAMYGEKGVSGDFGKWFRGRNEINLPATALGLRMQSMRSGFFAGHSFGDAVECGNPGRGPGHRHARHDDESQSLHRCRPDK